MLIKFRLLPNVYFFHTVKLYSLRFSLFSFRSQALPSFHSSPTFFNFPCVIENSFSPSIYSISAGRMGCEQSKLTKLSPVSLSIVDPCFLKPGAPSAALLHSRSIQPKVFMSIDCLLDSLAETYSHNIVVREEDFPRLQQELAKAKLDPRVFVLGKRRDGGACGKAVVFESYEELPGLLEHQEKPVAAAAGEGRRVELRILREFKGEAASQFFIFEETLRSKGVSYELYDSFAELEHSRTASPLLVVDYRFHRAAIALAPESKVICYCDLLPEESYDPQVFFVTNNFQEVVAEALLFKKLTQPLLPISKVFLFSASQAFLRYAPLFESFGLKVRAYGSVEELIKTTRLYFSVMVVCPEEEAAELERKIGEEGCGFRMRVLTIAAGAECSALGIRRVLREVKRGYMVERGPAKVVDIIDKYHSNAKFQEIKKSLMSNGIAFRCYSSIMAYCKTLPFIAPVIICNFDDRLLLHRFLSEVQIRAKVIVFCNRGRITEQLLKDSRWSFVSSHFGKIIGHIRGHHVLLPAAAGQGRARPQRERDHRVSAAQWAGNVTQAAPAQQHEHQQLAMAKEVSMEEVAAMGEKLRLQHRPVEDFEGFRSDLLASLAVLRSHYKLAILDGDFTSMVSEFSHSTLHDLLVRARRFLAEEKEVGLGINRTLRGDSVEEIRAVRQAFFLLSLNFLGVFQLPLSISCSVSCWAQAECLQACEEGSVVLARNFLVMREGTPEDIPGCVRLQLRLEHSPFRAAQRDFAPYFFFEGRYVFAPFSQFRVTAVEVEEGRRVVRAELLEENQFLKGYFSDNMGKQVQKVFKSELQKQNSVFFPAEQKHSLQTNLSRLEAYSLCSSDLPQAISIQRSLIRLQEQSENFDSRLLTELKFQLAGYLSLDSSSEELMELIGEIKEESPSGFVKKECAAMLGRLRTALEGRKEERARTNKCIELKEQIEREEDEEEELLQAGQCENIFQCLELDEREGLAEQFS